METLKHCEEAVQLFDKLLIYRSLKDEPIIAELSQIAANGPFRNNHSIAGWYGRLMELKPRSTNPWSSYLWEAIQDNCNYFSLACEQGRYASLPANILSAVLSDLSTLAKLLNWNPAPLVPVKLNEANGAPETYQHLLQGDSIDLLDWLGNFYKTRGAGLFGKYSSFTWSTIQKQFAPVTVPDSITVNDLIGYEYQKMVLLRNTSQFIMNLPANNILLYGDRGTGKSSLIRALHNQFSHQGLRLIEVNKDDLADFPEIIENLRNRGLKFILYVDDLSFEAGESGYKHLKAVLEGGLQVRPNNVLIYATSNRRHLIKETFADREEDLHSNDTVQEKTSLADRFGITLTFITPDQEEYLAIVKGLAMQRNITLPLEVIEAKAIQWERSQNGRSGRTAKQFIDQLEGELGLESEK